MRATGQDDEDFMTRSQHRFVKQKIRATGGRCVTGRDAGGRDPLPNRRCHLAFGSGGKARPGPLRFIDHVPGENRHRRHAEEFFNLR